MEAFLKIDAAGIYGSCLALSIVSAIVPWVNCELILFSLAALARSNDEVVYLVLLASVGQMAGKCLLYWAGRGAFRFQSDRVGRTIASWRERFERSSSRPIALVFVSSAVGIPPFYVTTVLAGALGLQFGRFLGVGMCGRLVRFGLLIFIPQLAVRLTR